MSNSIYINVTGGTGLNISLSQIIPELVKKYDEVAICSPYWDIFEATGDCIVYKPNEIRDFLMDGISKKAKLVVERLYDKESFIYKTQSYEDAWRDLCGLDKRDKAGTPSSTKSCFPKLYEKFPFLAKQKEDILKQIHEKFDKYIIIQFTGGQSPLVQVPAKDGKPDWTQVPYDYNNEPLKRHYPIDLAQKFVDLFIEKHPDIGIIVYQLPNEPTPTGSNIITFQSPYLLYYALAKDAIGTVSIDSSLQHLVAGVTKSVVVWGHSLPENFGYEYNKNIIQDCRRNDIFYFTALGPSGAAIRYIQPEKLLKEVDDYLFETKGE